ncbi:exopolysaccharide biosynthesis protein [Salipiger bermudensis]|uniref:Probable exopolysaccharide synthesis protein n=1 Tax=Salipiger bermudensis (strain DSM 26914 / JCM 13377 / KCTC 12554 / HTCC2601) TaxID=314265 RepID=Q0FVG5_SALBH|nr:exopolysaccharide biosynthesis protein [Salipiger bermudensis]MAE89491.1 exopolysaccharide synthesis protein [Pelagibaca sp.]MBR9893631.1 exopolysaccharide biosynthesis protein [bacterium]EAU48161.1 probable exopolysaccharide synthesis protein [Salipiger bermudensis HTCC2601]MBN9676218.1 exopolysaccharide biosynthesis protein [Salipiger bermudensis]MCA1287422.1 exopolysaccharide biosynthesis protein [Salipiger bermudensis]
MDAQSGHQPVGEIVDRLDAVVKRDNVSLRDLFEEFGESSFLPALMVPSLLVVSPLSGIPLFSSVCGLTIAFISAQMLISRKHLWLPDMLMRMKIDGPKARTAVQKMRGVGAWIDRHSRHRLPVFLTAPMRKWLQLLCMLCGFAMPFLEIVPFSSSLLGSAVTLLATAMLARDGLFALLGSIAIATAALVPVGVIGAI